MIPELVISAVVGVLVFGGLAFHDAIADCVVGVDRDAELVDLEDPE